MGIGRPAKFDVYDEALDKINFFSADLVRLYEALRSWDRARNKATYDEWVEAKLKAKASWTDLKKEMLTLNQRHHF
jgi:hypothetical protein